MQSAKQIFEELEEVGVFHRTPDPAAIHVSEVWDDISTWWDSPAVAEVVGKFRDTYLLQPSDLVARIGRCVISAGRTT